MVPEISRLAVRSATDAYDGFKPDLIFWDSF